MALQQRSLEGVYSESWLGGLWEAEGSMSYLAGAKSNIQMKINMKDFATVRRAYTVAGSVGNFRMQPAPPDKPHHNKQLRWYVSRYEEQMSVVGRLIPFLFEERIATVNRLLNANIEYTQPTIDWDWLVGYIDGEGSLLYTGCTQRITICCCSLDVLKAVQAYVGVGKIAPLKRREGLRQPWEWAIYGNNARSLMRDLYPMMSQRRQFQIDHALAGRSIVDRPNYKTLVGEGRG